MISSLVPKNGTPADRHDTIVRSLDLVAKTTSTVYLSWRLLGTDPSTLSFNVYRPVIGGIEQPPARPSPSPPAPSPRQYLPLPSQISPGDAITLTGGVTTLAAPTADDSALIDRGTAKGLNTWVFGDFDYEGQVTQADDTLLNQSAPADNVSAAAAPTKPSQPEAHKKTPRSSKK